MSSPANISADTKCPRCEAVVHWDVERCPKCRLDVGPPNVRLVSQAAERDALQARYDLEKTDWLARGVATVADQFEQAVRDNSKAAVNVWPDFLWLLLNERRTLYVNYHLLADHGIRKPASFEHDSRRRGTDGILFGGLASTISFGALSLNGRGTVSYGCVTLLLAEETAAGGATCLERNSYHFVTQHRIVPGDPIPPGYRCVWTDRGRLAVTKLGAKLQPATPPGEFPALLLQANGNRADDEFVEVHLYGSFDWQAVQKITIEGAASLNADDRQRLNNARDLAEGMDIVWSEL